jgi:hypothetical protein
MYNSYCKITKIKYMYFCDLYLLTNNNTFENLIISKNMGIQYVPNIEIGTEYKIFKTKNKQIYCINKNSQFIDLKYINQNYLKFMKIYFKSFNDSLSDDLIYDDIIININNINNVLNQIINYAFDIGDQIKMILPKQLLTSNIHINTDINKNLKIINFKIDTYNSFDSKLKLITNFFNYIYNNLDKPSFNFRTNTILYNFILKTINIISDHIPNILNISTDTNNHMISMANNHMISMAIDSIIRLFESIAINSNNHSLN